MYNSIPGASSEPPWSLLVTFHSSAKSAPGCSQEHYLSTWPSQSTPWALPVPSSKFLMSSWGFLVCLKNSLKQRVWSTWPSRSPPWTPTLDPPRSFCFVMELLGLPPGYPGALPGHPGAPGLSQAAPRDGAVVDGSSIRLSANEWWTGPQLHFPRKSGGRALK